MRVFKGILAGAVVMVILSGVSATASTELRERMYDFKDLVAVWKPERTHVICDGCPRLRRPPKKMFSSVAGKLADAKIPATKDGFNSCSSSPVSLLSSTSKPASMEIPGRNTTIYFDFDSDELKKPEVEKLRAFVKQLGIVSGDEPVIEVTGYTDSVGGREYNERLAFDRAFSVYRGLEALNTPSGGIRLYGKGKCCYAVKNNPASGKNRRAEVIEIKKAFASGKSTRCNQPVGGRSRITRK